MFVTCFLIFWGTHSGSRVNCPLELGTGHFRFTEKDGKLLPHLTCIQHGTLSPQSKMVMIPSSVMIKKKKGHVLVHWVNGLQQLNWKLLVCLTLKNNKVSAVQGMMGSSCPDAVLSTDKKLVHSTNLCPWGSREEMMMLVFLSRFSVCWALLLWVQAGFWIHVMVPFYCAPHSLHPYSSESNIDMHVVT